MSVSGIIDQSETLGVTPIGRESTLTIQQDGGTPAGDTVKVVIKDLGLNYGSILDVENGATATIVNLFDPTALSQLTVGNGATLNLEDHDAKRFAAYLVLQGTNATLKIGADVKISPNNFIFDTSATNTIELNGTTAAYGKWFQFSDLNAGSLHLYDSSHHYLRALYFEGTHTVSDFTVTANAGGTAVAEIANNGSIATATHAGHAGDVLSSLLGHWHAG